MSDDAHTDLAADALRVLRGAAAAPDARPYLTAAQGRHLLAEVDGLRAELDRHREAGDGVAESTNALLAKLPYFVGYKVAQAERDACVRADNGWLSVRGDAPADDPDTWSEVDDAQKSREDVITERNAMRRAWKQEQERRKALARELVAVVPADAPTDAPAEAMREVNEEIARLLPPVDSEAFRARDYSVPAAAPTDGQAPADDDMAVRRRAATAITAFRDALPVEHFDRERAQLDRLAEWLERGGSNYWNAPAHALVRALAAAPADDTATPPTSVALRTTLRQIADEAVGVEGILQPGAAYALGKLADLVRAQPGCLPEHVADAITATADDTAAPDGPEPDRWHVEHDARVPHWDFPAGAYSGVTAWDEGIELDGELAEGHMVDAFERVAKALLAAIAWHRKFAAASPAQDTGEDN